MGDQRVTDEVGDLRYLSWGSQCKLPISVIGKILLLTVGKMKIMNKRPGMVHKKRDAKFLTQDKRMRNCWIDVKWLIIDGLQLLVVLLFGVHLDLHSIDFQELSPFLHIVFTILKRKISLWKSSILGMSYDYIVAI